MTSLANKIGYVDIARVVGEFYSKARTNSQIGHFFNHIENFSQHEVKITAFWWLALGGQIGETLPAVPAIDMPGAHSRLGICESDLNVWLNLFEQTLFEVLDMKLAGEWQLQVHSIANRLKDIVIQNRMSGVQIDEHHEIP